MNIHRMVIRETLKRILGKIKSPSSAETMFEDYKWRFVVQNLPPVYRDARFWDAYRVLASYIDCTEETQLMRLLRAEECPQGSRTFAFVTSFFKCSTVSFLNDWMKIENLQQRAQQLYDGNPTEFVIVARALSNRYSSLFEENGLESVQYAQFGSPEVSKLLYIIFIAIMYVLRPIVCFELLYVSEDQIDRVLDFCIDINLQDLKKELERDTTGIE